MPTRARPYLIRTGWCRLLSHPRRGRRSSPADCDHAGVSLSRRRLRTLRHLEQDLAASDPGLSELFLSFTARAGECEMPQAERVARWSFRTLTPRWRGRSVTERVTDRHAENRNDP